MQDNARQHARVVYSGIATTLLAIAAAAIGWTIGNASNFNSQCPEYHDGVAIDTQVKP